MKRLRVSDIEALLGPDAAARLVEGVKDQQGKQNYVIEVDAFFKTRELVEAKSAASARQIAEKRVAELYADGPERPFVKSRVVRELDNTPTRAEDTNKPAAKGPGSTPRPKRQPRPSRD